MGERKTGLRWKKGRLQAKKTAAIVRGMQPARPLVAHLVGDHDWNPEGFCQVLEPAGHQPQHLLPLHDARLLMIREAAASPAARASHPELGAGERRDRVHDDQHCPVLDDAGLHLRLSTSDPWQTSCQYTAVIASI